MLVKERLSFYYEAECERMRVEREDALQNKINIQQSNEKLQLIKDFQVSYKNKKKQYNQEYKAANKERYRESSRKQSRAYYEADIASFAEVPNTRLDSALMIILIVIAGSSSLHVSTYPR
jgi:hypothetical protein